LYRSSVDREVEELANPKDRTMSVDVKKDMIVAGGYRYLNGIENFGLIIIGKK
jgi:hypothetical protein